MDTQLPEYYNMIWFLKKEGNFSIDEIYMIHPFEFEIYYYMAVNDFNERQKQMEEGQNFFQ